MILNRSLQELSSEEWEQLCDGCGRCCLIQMEDEDTLERVFTAVSCRYLDIQKCRCSVYETRQEKVPECIVLTQENVNKINWMPSTCAYRLRRDNLPLFPWHPLIANTNQLMHQEGVSVQDFAISEAKLDEYADWNDYIITLDDDV